MTPEQRQRAHELNCALGAARKLQERLEMLGDRATDVRVIVSLRNSLACEATAQAVYDAPAGWLERAAKEERERST